MSNGYLAVVAALCKSERWPLPVAEYVFAQPRKWRFDLAWPAHWLAVEIEGGNFIAGRHARGAGLRAEYEKRNDAAIRGWVVLQILPEQIQGGELTDLLRRYFAMMYPHQHGGRKWKPPQSSHG
jgi:hypothetical protein